MTVPIVFTSCGAQKNERFWVIAHDGIRLVPGRNAVNAKRATDIKKHLQNSNDLAQWYRPSAALLWRAILLEQNTAVLKVTSPVFLQGWKNMQRFSTRVDKTASTWCPLFDITTTQSRFERSSASMLESMFAATCALCGVWHWRTKMRGVLSDRTGSDVSGVQGGQRFKRVQIMSEMVNVARTLRFL